MNTPAQGPRAFLVGGGIAALAAAVYLLRDGHFPGASVRILEEESLGGSLDASGAAELGFSMRGSRMYGAAYELMYELLSHIPSLDDPGKSVTQDTLDFWVEAPWHDKARLVEQGRIVDAAAFGLANKDRVDLIGFMLRGEEVLGARRIDECFDAHFFTTNFWFMWRSMFGFETWHSAAELRRYLLRFLRLFPDLPTLKIIQSTRYNGRDSIVRPIVRWLETQGVQFELGVQVTDLDFAAVAHGRQAVRRIRATRAGAPADIELGEGDLVIVTLGSMTADSTVGTMDSPPPPVQRRSGAWPLWERLAAKNPGFGRSTAFCGDVERSKWVTFTVTHADDRFVRRIERFSDSPAGQGGLVTLKDSSWGLTFHLFHPPAYAGQPPGTQVWWGYGLFADRAGDFVARTMPECSGALSPATPTAQGGAASAGATNCRRCSKAPVASPACCRIRRASSCQGRLATGRRWFRPAPSTSPSSASTSRSPTTWSSRSNTPSTRRPWPWRPCSGRRSACRRPTAGSSTRMH